MAFLGRESGRDEARAARYAAWFARQHPLALPSLLLAAFSLTHLGTLWVDEILAIVLGAVALRQIARARRDGPGGGSTARPDGRLLAAGGVAVGAVSLALAVVIYFVLPKRA